MKKVKLSGVLILALGVMSMLSACGGGGSSSPPPQPTTAVLTLSTAVTGTIPAGTTINSYDITVTLPAGVTVKSTTSPPETDTGVVTVTGMATGSQVGAVYTPPSGNQAGKVKIYIANGAGFRAGEFCVVNCDISKGTNPSPSDFAPPTLDDATGFDANSKSTVLGLESELSLAESAAIH